MTVTDEPPGWHDQPDDPPEPDDTKAVDFAAGLGIPITEAHDIIELVHREEQLADDEAAYREARHLGIIPTTYSAEEAHGFLETLNHDYYIPIDITLKPALRPDRTRPQIDTGRVDLGPILRGDQPAAQPGIVHRADGGGLFYPGALHDLHGEPGHGKTWLFFHAGAETLNTGGSFGILDFEGTPHSFVERMRALGVDDDTLADPQRVAYHNIIGKTSPVIVATLADQFTSMGATLVGIDAMLPALVRNGLDDNSNTDQATFFDTVTRPLAATGAAIIVIDHLTRDPNTRTRGARGGGAKLQLLDVSYLVKLTRPFSRTRAGSFKLTCQKDRNGIYSIGETVAAIDITPELDGRLVTLTLRVPEHHDTDAPFRPTQIMEAISRALEDAGELNTRSLRTAARGRDELKPLATNLLVNEGFVERQSQGREVVYRSIRPFRHEESEQS